MLQQVDPLSLADGASTDLDDVGGGGDGYVYGGGSERYTDGGGGSRQGTATSEASRRGPRSIPTTALGESLPLPTFEKPRCVSGKIPGGLCYVRATLPPADEAPKHRGGKGRGGSGSGGESDDDDGAGGGEVEGKDSGGGAGGEGGDAVKSFTTGAIVVGRNGRDSREKKEEKGGDTADEGDEDGVTGDYCLVRVDSLDRVCDIIYCGRGGVEAKNLSKVVGVQLGYLQASDKNIQDT